MFNENAANHKICQIAIRRPERCFVYMLCDTCWTIQVSASSGRRSDRRKQVQTVFPPRGGGFKSGWRLPWVKKQNLQLFLDMDKQNISDTHTHTHTHSWHTFMGGQNHREFPIGVHLKHISRRFHPSPIVQMRFQWHRWTNSWWILEWMGSGQALLN